MKRKTIGEVPGNVLGMMADLCHKLQYGNRTPKQLDLFLKGENPFTTVEGDLTELIKTWERHLKRWYGIKFPFSRVKIPEIKQDFNWIVPLPACLRENRIYEVLAKHFPCWKYTNDLDRAMVRDNFDREKNLVIRIRDRQEADEEFKGLSAEDLDKKQTKTLNLRGRGIVEGWYFDLTDKHLDVENITLCAGSRDSVGHVPGADWYFGGFRVRWYSPQSAFPDIRARAVVSLS